MLRNPYITEVLQNGQWQGRRCFIIGGGPSLLNFAPERLDGELSIGVNKAFVKYNPQLNYAMDPIFHEQLTTRPNILPNDSKLKQDWENYKGLRIFLQTAVNFYHVKRIYIVKRRIERCISLDLEQGIYTGNNSGFGALMLAVALKANPIYLLGFDMQVSEDKTQTHWHDGYRDCQGNTQSPRNLERKMKQFIKEFNFIALALANLGVKVINLNPESRLNAFSKQNITEVL